MATTFGVGQKTQPPTAVDDPMWLNEIETVEYAVNLLLEAKRTILASDPVYEQVLWARYVERLREIKRKLDAVCL